MRLIDADELITAFPCGESVRTESVRATIKNMPTIEVGEDRIKAFKDGQKDMLMFLLEGMKNALEKARNERIEK